MNFLNMASTWNIRVFKNSKWYATTAPEFLLSFQQLQGISDSFFILLKLKLDKRTDLETLTKGQTPSQR